MKNVTIIAAIGRNNELGLNNKLIWNLPQDLQFFKKQTMGKPIVMGRKTYESLPKLLPGRKHIVLSSSDIVADPQVIVVHTKQQLLDLISEYSNEVMIIGGATLYAEMLEYANKLILTEIDDVSLADAFFPSFDKKDWNCKILDSDEENGVKYQHFVYTRK